MDHNSNWVWRWQYPNLQINILLVLRIRGHVSLCTTIIFLRIPSLPLLKSKIKNKKSELRKTQSFHQTERLKEQKSNSVVIPLFLYFFPVAMQWPHAFISWKLVWWQSMWNLYALWLTQTQFCLLCCLCCWLWFYYNLIHL